MYHFPQSPELLPPDPALNEGLLKVPGNDGKAVTGFPDELSIQETLNSYREELLSKMPKQTEK